MIHKLINTVFIGPERPFLLDLKIEASALEIG